MSHCSMSLMRRRFVAWMTAGVMCASVVGCGPKAKTLKTEEVEGLVTLDDKPVPEATVTFIPVQQDVGISATGMTDAEGKYRLTAMASGSSAQAQAGAGTMPGEYYVGVVKVILPEHPTSTEAAMPKEGQRPADSAMTYVVPQMYENPQKSGIKVTVKAGKNDIPIPLTSK